MSIGKREVTLLIALGVLLYAFLFYTLILQNFIPDFKDVSDRLTVAQKKEAMLKDDQKNIDKLRLKYNSKSIQNERMEGYLLGSADVTDCIEYMDKLVRMIGNKFKDVNILEPQEKYTGPKTVTKVENSEEDVGSGTGTSTSTDTSDAAAASPKPATKSEKYYELPISFKANLTYDEITNLLNFIEGGTKRIKVSKFKLGAPKPTTVGIGAAAKQVLDVKTYDIDMELNMYSQNVGDLDKMYNYGRNRFSNYIKGNGLQFEGMPEISYAIPSPSPSSSSSSSAEAAKNISLPSDTSSSAEIIILESGYLTAADNLRMYGINRAEDVIRLRTNTKADLSLVVTNTKFTLTSPNNSGRMSTITGRLPDGDLNVDMALAIPDIKENEKIRLNLKITNNSSKKINVKLSDDGRRAKILERNGTQISGESKKENVSIM